MKSRRRVNSVVGSRHCSFEKLRLRIALQTLRVANDAWFMGPDVSHIEVRRYAALREHSRFGNISFFFRYFYRFYLLLFVWKKCEMFLLLRH